MTNENETVEQVCEILTKGCKFDSYITKTDGRVVVLLPDMAKRILAAHKREIAELKANYELERFSVNKSIDEIAKRDALIKELADALVNDVIARTCGGNYHHICKRYKKCVWSKLCALVKKAREVVK